MLQEARPERSDKALLVDGGSGYLAELLRPMVGSLEVISTEEAATAHSGQGDYSLLVIDGAIEQFPDSLARSVAGNGRVVTGWLRDGITRLATGRVAAGEVALLPLAELGIPVLPEFTKPKGWSF
jgi:protein-L-isoaspartate(D-aspartate) O-methyltransferase